MLGLGLRGVFELSAFLLASETAGSRPPYIFVASLARTHRYVIGRDMVHLQLDSHNTGGGDFIISSSGEKPTGYLWLLYSSMFCYREGVQNYGKVGRALVLYTTLGP
jgi:hypothetical protein